MRLFSRSRRRREGRRREGSEACNGIGSVLFSTDIKGVLRNCEPCSSPHSHTHTHTHTLTHTYAHTLTHTHFLAHTHTLSHTHTFSHIHTLSLAHTHHRPHSLSHTHPNTTHVPTNFAALHVSLSNHSRRCSPSSRSSRTACCGHCGRSDCGAEAESAGAVPRLWDSGSQDGGQSR